MRQRASIGIAFLALSHLAFANASSVLAQAGSTGGTIGKTDKSMSGSEEGSGQAARGPSPEGYEVAGEAVRSVLRQDRRELDVVPRLN
jgi:hypothetical protein